MFASSKHHPSVIIHRHFDVSEEKVSENEKPVTQSHTPSGRK